ncbi:hypothetical protein TIFTF001_016527, partial [Ficus carica]
MSSSRSRHQEVTEFIVRPDVEEWAASTDESTMPNNDSILQEIDNNPEGGDLNGEGNGDSEETITEPPRQGFTTASYTTVTGDHRSSGGRVNNKLDFFSSKILKRDMENSSRFT